ncbi:MAG: hypothetical protein J5817_07650 [Treponema sp.]|nr:hypothetical protein [Treponema sp.]
MNLSNLLESGMLVCFGISWPINVVKAFRARTAKSTSLAFILLIITGYVAGICAKLNNHQYNYVLAVYFLNLVIVLTNVLVYFRNCALDKKREEVSMESAGIKKTNKVVYAHEEQIIFENEKKASANANNIVILGGTYDKEISAKAINDEYDLDFDLVNSSTFALSLKNAKEYFKKYLSSLDSEGIILHLGEEDKDLFKANPKEFDNLYLSLLSTIKVVNKKCSLALVSLDNPRNDALVSEMNRHIEGIASSEQADFINLENATLWNPKATKASTDFARSMGLNVKKPIFDVAKIVYSYASQNVPSDAGRFNIAG